MFPALFPHHLGLHGDSRCRVLTLELMRVQLSLAAGQSGVLAAPEILLYRLLFDLCTKIC